MSDGACVGRLEEVGGVVSSAEVPLYVPDSVWYYEVGAKVVFLKRKLSVNLAGYLIDWKNVQTLFALPQCTIQTALNLGSAKIDGFDLAVSVKPAAGLTVGGSVSYIPGR